MHPKVAAAGLAGAISVIIVWLLGIFNVDVPGEVASAFTVVISVGTGYLKSNE